MMGKNIPPFFRKLLIVFFLVVIASGILLRSADVIAHNYIFGFDQGRDYLMVRDIVVGHKLRLIGAPIGAGSAGFQGIFHGPGYFFILGIPFLLFNGDPYGGVILMLLFGIGTILLSFVLAKRMFGSMGALFVASLVAISPPLISASRFIWNSNPTVFFILITFYLVSKINHEKIRWLFFAAFAASFLYNFELAIAIPVCLAVFIYAVLIFKIKTLKSYASLIAGFVVGFSPGILFEAKHNFMGVRGLIDYFSKPHSSNISFINNIKEHYGAFLYNFADTFPHQTIILPTLILLVLLISVLYISFKEKNTKLKNFIIFLLLLVPVHFIVLSFLRNAVYPYYLFDLNVAYIFLFAYAVFNLRKKNNFLFFFFVIIYLLFVIKSVPENIKTFNTDIKDYGGNAKIKGEIDAVDYIYKDAGNKKFGLFVFAPPVYTYQYDYVLVWYAKNKYGYIPYKENKGTFYLLVEVDSTKPWSYLGWEQTVIKTGKIIWTKKLPSGFIVEKRIQE